MERNESTGDARRWGVLLMAYGGPDSLDDVEPYLLDVRGGRPTPSELIAEVRERYARIGGSSPLLGITRAQAVALEERLRSDPENPVTRVYVGMRHWRPYIREAVGEILADGLNRIVAICMSPHYSRMSIGAYFARLREAQDELGAQLQVVGVDNWHDNPLLVRAIAVNVRAALDRFPADARDRVHVVFTAHSLPAAIMEQGDPYDAQVRETARLVATSLGLPDDRWEVCYQSAGARRERWLGPSLAEALNRLAGSQTRNVLVAPVGFVSDHVEVLFDVDVEAKELAGQLGLRLERMDSLNTTPAFVEALADVVKRALARA